MNTSEEVPIDALGICESCNKVINFLDYADSQEDETWHCIHCRAVVGYVAFGYDKPTEEGRKQRWVGPDSKWTKVKPEDNFDISGYNVTAREPRFWRS